MKTALLFLCMVCLITATNAQLNEKCATMPSLAERLENNPDLRLFIEQQRAKKMNLKSTINYDTTGYVVIPVVFHVVYDPGVAEQNIPDSNIFSQINVLNADYSYASWTSSTTIPLFDSIAANTGIRFCLATRDPLGNPTNGITRTSSTTSHLATPLTNSVKHDATGGKDPWPRNQYLNIWVCSMFPAILGYATFPWDSPSLDGIVLNYKYVGEHPGGPTAPNNMGRTNTHESGHWLGMRHIWGDGACGVEDGIDDTPDSDAASSSDCALTRNDCNDAGNLFWGGYNPVDMVQNFMDYSADGCMSLYTRGQMHRMWHYVLTYRDSLFYSMGCDTPKLNAYAISKNITCGNSCDGEATVTPVVGTAPFKFLWNTPNTDTTAMVDSLCKGAYAVRVIDADNDTIYVPVYINTNNNLTATLDTMINASCLGCPDGSISVNAIGGSPSYSYSLNGGTPQVSNTFTGLTNGTYTVTISDSCGNSVDLVISVGTVGNNEINSSKGIRIFPNPLNQFLNIINENNKEYMLLITDISGRCVHKQLFNGNYLQIDVSKFDNGAYLVQIYDGTKPVFNEKIIKIN